MCCGRAGEWKAAKAKPHPLYQTSSQAVGAVPKGVTPDLVPPKFGRAGRFTDTFVGSGNFRDSGLNTTVSKSRYASGRDGLMTARCRPSRCSPVPLSPLPDVVCARCRLVGMMYGCSCPIRSCVASTMCSTRSAPVTCFSRFHLLGRSSGLG